MHVKMKTCEPVFNGPVLCVPVVARVPLQAPLAVHDVASVLDQLNVDESPATSELGFGASETVGAAVDGGEGGDDSTLSPPSSQAASTVATNNGARRRADAPLPKPNI